MKSNVCRLASEGSGLLNALEEVEKTAAYNNLGKKNALRLRGNVLGGAGRAQI